MTTNTPEAWEEDILDLKCVNGAMYFGSVEDDSCDCKTRCQNEQTFEHATEELTAYVRSLLHTTKVELLREINEHIDERDYIRLLASRHGITEEELTNSVWKR